MTKRIITLWAVSINREVSRPLFSQEIKAGKDRTVFLEPVAEIKRRFHLTDQQILKLVGSTYGLRAAPRNWYQRVKRDMQGLRWKVHSLDTCVFLLYDKDELIGICGVYVDDFIIGGKDSDQRWQASKKRQKDLYAWGRWERTTFH